MSLRILADENIPAAQLAFADLGTVTTAPGRSLAPADLADVDVLLVRSVTRVDCELLAGSAVRFVGTATSGVDHIDQQYLDEQGIEFASAHGANANSVVEYALAAIATVGDFLERLLAGGRVGIIGYGAVGSLLCRRLMALGINVNANDPWLQDSRVSNNAPLDKVLSADVICVHAELTDRAPWPSRHLLDLTALSSLSADQLLINAGRGAVVDNRALANVLSSEGAPAVVLDVWENEPDIDLQLLPLVRIATPHIAGYSYDGKLRATTMLRNACGRWLGEKPQRSERDLLPEAPAIELGEAQSVAGLLRHLFGARYNILKDDQALREVADQGELGGGFDRLRRDYFQRRELAGSKVRGGTAVTRDTLQALGCIDVDGSSP